MLRQAKALVPLLEEAGISSTEVFSPGNHSYAYWASNFPAYFRWLAQDFLPNTSIRPLSAGTAH